MLTDEKLDEIRTWLEQTTEIIEMPCTRDQHLEIVRSQSNKAVNLNSIKNVFMYMDIIFSISYNLGKLILLLLWSDT